MDAIIDENGTITNIEDIKKAADKKKNDMADRYAKEHKDDKALEKKEKESTKKWKKRIKDNLALESEKAMVDAQYDTLMELIDQYYNSVELKRHKLTEQIEKEVELIQSKLERTTYQVELKIEVDDLQDFEFKFVIVEKGKIKIWESGENNVVNFTGLIRQFQFNRFGRYNKYEYEYNPSRGSLLIKCHWKK